MTNQQCEACTAAWGDIGSNCADRHGSAVLALAARLAEVCQHPDPTLQQVGWFTDDAEAVLDIMGQQDKWTVVFTLESARSPDGYDPIIEINGVKFRCGEGPMSVYIEANDV